MEGSCITVFPWCHEQLFHYCLSGGLFLRHWLSSHSMDSSSITVFPWCHGPLLHRCLYCHGMDGSCITVFLVAAWTAPPSLAFPITAWMVPGTFLCTFLTLLSLKLQASCSPIILIFWSMFTPKFFNLPREMHLVSPNKSTN